jgi:hypothetical protein
MGFLHKDGFSPIILVTLHTRIIDNIIYVLLEAILKYQLARLVYYINLYVGKGVTNKDVQGRIS